MQGQGAQLQLYGAGQLEFQGSRPSSNLSDQQ
eukprot:COSAG05_NODE_22664_length_263_cov_0.634146_1_plen_31_part_10